MDEKKDICGATTSTGNIEWICKRKPHADISRKPRWDREGNRFFAEPPTNSHRFVNKAKL